MRPRNEWPTETGVGMSGPVRHEHEDTRPVKKVKWHRLSTTGPLLAAAATAAGWRSSPKSLTPDAEARRTRSSFRNDGTGRSLRPLPAAPTAANRRLDEANWMPKRSTRACSAMMYISDGEDVRPRDWEGAHSSVPPVTAGAGSEQTSGGTGSPQRVCRDASGPTVDGRGCGREWWRRGGRWRRWRRRMPRPPRQPPHSRSNLRPGRRAAGASTPCPQCRCPLPKSLGPAPRRAVG